MNSQEPAPPADSEPPPPILGRWSRVYAVVLVALGLTMIAMGWLTVHYR